MPGYTKINLLEVDSSSKDNKDVEFRFGRKHLNSRDLGVTFVRYAPNHRPATAHSHKEQEEAYVVVEGSGQILVGKELIPLAKWDVVRVAPETTRAIAAGPEGITVIAVGGPKPEGGDGVMQQPDWPAE